MKLKGWHRALLIIIPFLITTGFFQLFGFLFTSLPLNDMESVSVDKMVVITFCGMLGTVTVVLMFLKLVDNKPIAVLGFTSKRFFPHLFFSGMAVAVSMVASFLLLLAFCQIRIQFYEFELNPFFHSVLLFVFVALGEEIFCRGYILMNLLQSFSVGLALILSSVLFSFLHLLNPNISVIGIINLFVSGILLGVSYLYSNSLWMPISIHFFWNLIQSHLGFMVSGLDIYSICNISIINSTIWNGGEFGFEGSILSVFIQVVAIVLLWRVVKTKQKLHYF